MQIKSEKSPDCSDFFSVVCVLNIFEIDKNIKNTFVCFSALRFTYFVAKNSSCASTLARTILSNRHKTLFYG